MEERCRDIEATIASNNEIIDEQTEEIVRNIVAGLASTNPWNQERLRRMLNNSWAPDCPAGDDGGEEHERNPVPCFVLATIVVLMLVISVVLLGAR